MKFLTCLRTLSKSDQGSSLVELALVIPMLLVLTLGALDLGYAYNEGLKVASAAHAGAEYGVLNATDTTGMTNAAKADGTGVPNLTVATPTYGCECSSGTSYNADCTTPPTCTGSTLVHRVSVTVTAVYHPLSPWPALLTYVGMPSTITLSKTSTMRTSQ